MNLFKLLVLSLFILNNLNAQEISDEVNSSPYDQRYGAGSDEFELERFDNDNVHLAIKRDMEVACNKQGLCTLSAVTSNDQRFTAQFFIGEGNNFGQFGGGGTTVIVPGSNGNFFPTGQYYGINLRYTRAKCTQTIKVPRSLYISINRYMYGLMTEEGGTRRGYTPADEAMIMFYSTIMKQASGCVAGQ